MAAPLATEVRIHPGIGRTLHHGLENVSLSLLIGSPPPLPANSQLTLVLDLTPWGDDLDEYRLTHLRHPQGQVIHELLVDHVGRVTGATSAQEQAWQTALENKFARHRFVRQGDWIPAEWTVVLHAISLTSDELLTRIRGVTLRRMHLPPRRTRRGRESDDYDLVNHRIQIYDRNFNETGLTCLGRPGLTGISMAVRTILPEIGHAVDLAPLQQAVAATPDDPERRDAPFNRARSVSGLRSRWNQKEEKYTLANGGRGAQSIAFRQAYAQDGGLSVTDDPRTSWEECFAEAFALFLSDPDTLRRRRPHVYEYLHAAYPER